MRSFVLTVAARLLVPLLLLFSWYLLWRGHNAPGGGFIGGLIAAMALLLYGLAEGPQAVRRLARVPPAMIAMAGVGVSLLAGLAAALEGSAFLTGLWIMLGGGGDDAGSKGLALGTPLLFDVGVYLVVLGAVHTMSLALEEDRP